MLVKAIGLKRNFRIIFNKHAYSFSNSNLSQQKKNLRQAEQFKQTEMEIEAKQRKIDDIDEDYAFHKDKFKVINFVQRDQRIPFQCRNNWSSFRMFLYDLRVR